MSGGNQVVPAATYSQLPGDLPVCQNCSTSTTPLWRRDESGTVLCNACGLFLKLHGRSRPISLKTNTIKSRNRGRAAQQRRTEAQGSDATDSAAKSKAKLRKQAQAASAAAQDLPPALDPYTSESSNIAPQHIFDSLTSITDFNTTASPALQGRQPSPSNVSLSGTSLEPLTYETLLSHNGLLKTRVSELEVINDLFRGRVSELEHAEREARQAESEQNEEVKRLGSELEAALAKVALLQSQLDGLT